MLFVCFLWKKGICTKKHTCRHFPNALNCSHSYQWKESISQNETLKKEKKDVFFFKKWNFCLWRCKADFKLKQKYCWLNESTHLCSVWPHLQSCSYMDKRSLSFENRTAARTDMNNTLTVFFLPRNSVTVLRHRRHYAGWISLTKLCMEAFMVRGTPEARLRQSCLSTGSQQCNGVCSQFASCYSLGVNIIYGRKSLWFSEPC